MSDMTGMRDRLMNEFSENYMEKLFYFCLKKTGNQIEAEDLTQDIALNIITALNKGILPENFSAWVWRIARNRYAKWADQKHRRSESVTGSDISYYEIIDESANVSDEMVYSEQLSLLRRELAFIRSEYRNIVVAYYIDNKSMHVISDMLSLSLEAVKKRLQRARSILKEGMDMAREFGIRSYKPEDIMYSINMVRKGDKQQPHSIMEHDLYVNIMLQAYGNPSTAEELALELGVALPYMENELEYLTRETFLIKKENKYQTAFPIVSREAQEKVHMAQLEAAPQVTKALTDVVDAVNKAFEAQGYAYYGAFQDYESAKWSLLMLAYDRCRYQRSACTGWTKRPDNGEWDIIGYQVGGMREPNFVGNHGSKYGFQQFKYEFDGIADRTPYYLTDDEAKVLRDFVLEKTDDAPTDVVDALVRYGYLSWQDGALRPEILVLNLAEIKDCAKALDAKSAEPVAAAVDRVKELTQALYLKIENIVKADLPEAHRREEFKVRLAIEDRYHARGYVIADALRCGWLLPEDRVSPVIGAHLYL